jgi:predicted nucleic acid-binding protein
MIYIDVNVFAPAKLNTESIGEDARAILRAVQEGKLEASSSVLSFDEVVWSVKKNTTSDESIMAGEAFLNMPGLKLVEVDREILATALSHAKI